MIKKILYLSILLVINIAAHGATHVVSNQPGVKRDFSSIQSAIEQAAPYDTIFVKGSPMNYGNVLLEKPLVLIGEGFSADIHTGHTAKITRILFTSNPYRRTISSGSKVIGFEFPYFPGQRPNIITVANERVKIEDITIERNWLWFVEVVGSADNWIFRNNIIRGWVNGGARDTNPQAGAAGFLFQNNIINSVMNFKRGSVTLENNIIMGRFRDIYHAVVQDNIFTRDELLLEDVSGSRFINNITMTNKIGNENCYEQPARFESKFLCDGNPNTGSGNRIAADPGFVYWPSDDIMGGTVFKLSDGSSIKRAGRNGREPGIFGGNHPFPSNAFLNPEIADPFPSFVTSIY